MSIGINNAIGKSFLEIESILTDQEKLKVAQLWNKGVSKNWAGINVFMANNLVECIQPRRLDPETGFTTKRHMLATRNFWLAAKMAKIKGERLTVKQPRGDNWYKKRNLILVWDIVFNNFRMIDLTKPNDWRILDFIPFSNDDHFVKVANVWTTMMKGIEPGSSQARTYCNYLRKGI